MGLKKSKKKSKFKSLNFDLHSYSNLVLGKRFSIRNRSDSINKDIITIEKSNPKIKKDSCLNNLMIICRSDVKFKYFINKIKPLLNDELLSFFIGVESYKNKVHQLSYIEKLQFFNDIGKMCIKTDGKYAINISDTDKRSYIELLNNPNFSKLEEILYKIEAEIIMLIKTSYWKEIEDTIEVFALR